MHSLADIHRTQDAAVTMLLKVTAVGVPYGVRLLTGHAGVGVAGKGGGCARQGTHRGLLWLGRPVTGEGADRIVRKANSLLAPCTHPKSALQVVILESEQDVEGIVHIHKRLSKM